MVYPLAGLLFTVLVSFVVWRWRDYRTDEQTWRDLAENQPESPVLFVESLIDGLPEPAQRYFRFSINPGAPLYTVAEISMQGDISLASKETPDYMPILADQILAAPHGFLWRIKTGKGLFKITGSDAAIKGKSWSRFWLLGIAPIVRAGGNIDHARSAFGRYMSEAIFWTPAAFMPNQYVTWTPVDGNTARVSVTFHDLTQAVDLSVDSNGQPKKLYFSAGVT